MAGCFVLLLAAAAATPATAPARPAVEAIVAEIRKADYEGDRAALRRLHEELEPFRDEAGLSSRVRYWRGFALWRRAINGFNETVAATEQEKDLIEAIAEFDAASSADPTFSDPMIGAYSSAGYLFYLHRDDPERIRALATRYGPSRQKAQSSIPDHPRMVWAMGPLVWNTPAERGGGADQAIASYRKAIEAMRRGTGVSSDPLDPSWGEPELLMSLAWSLANRPSPDLQAAEAAAREALALVPHWHYVKDILLPQILEAKAKTKAP